MNEKKHILQSRTFWGALFMLAGAVLEAAGLPFEIGPLEDFVYEVLDLGLITGGMVLTLAGRYLAEKKIYVLPSGGEATDHE